MKWLNHQVLTGVAVYALTDDLLLTACGMAGAIFPDKVEGNPRRGLLSIGWRSRHRGWSHWLALYLALLFFILQLGDFSLVSSSGETVVSLKAASVQWMAGFLCSVIRQFICRRISVHIYFSDFFPQILNFTVQSTDVSSALTYQFA